ncbi:hypothetical protein [Wenyingzhuangia sp. IMCC45467]
MNKFIFPIAIIIIFAISVVVKISNKKHFLENSVETTGKVIEEFQRGKLPYCTYTYSVNSVDYKKDQEVPKQMVNKVKNKEFTVVYQADKPNESYIDLK